MTKSRIIAPSDSWSTNREFYETLDRRFHFDPFDPCPMDCPETFNGLTTDWIGDCIFVNPPYSTKLKEAFVRRSFEESKQGKTIVLLIPVSTSTKLFHEVIEPNATVELLRGRIPFEGIDNGWKWDETKTIKLPAPNWVNPMQGLYRPKGVTEDMPKLNRGGQFDSMVVTFRAKVRPKIIGWDWRNKS